MGKMIREYLTHVKNEIYRNTEGMNSRDKWAYILTYYWYHLLGIFAFIFLTIFLIVHFAFGMEKPAFTCVLVNQDINHSRDEEIAEALAEETQSDVDDIVIDSDFNISYGDVQLTGANESSYEKFFLKWRNKELDAVILPESFYQYCKEMGGSYVNLDEMDTGSLPLYTDQESGLHTAVLVEQTWLKSSLVNDTDEKLLLVFTEDGENRDMCQKFLTFLNNREMQQENDNDLQS